MTEERPVSVSFPLTASQQTRETVRPMGEPPPSDSSNSSVGDASKPLSSPSSSSASSSASLSSSSSSSLSSSSSSSSVSPVDPRGLGASAAAVVPSTSSASEKLSEIFHLLQQKYHVDSRMLDSLQEAISSFKSGPSLSSSLASSSSPRPEQTQAAAPARAAPSAEEAAVVALGTLGGRLSGQGASPLALPGSNALLSFDVYERIYNRFCIWILSLFEDCREELMDVAFAVLLHMFRKLLTVDAYQAHQLLRRFSPLHAGKHGSLLKQLEDAEPVHPLQLCQIPYFASEERNPLYISERAYFLLRTWLVDTRCLLLEVMIQAASRLLPPPSHAPHARGLVYRGLLGPSLSQSLLSPPSSHPLSSLPAGLRRHEETPAPTTQEKAVAQRAGDLAFFDAPPPFRSQPGDPEKGEKSDEREEDRSALDNSGELPPVVWGLPRQFFREETTVIGPSGERTKRVRLLGGENLRETELAEPNSLLPLPEPPKDSFLLYRRLIKQQTERRAPLSAAAGQWPSIACMTVLNSSSESACCAVSPSTCRLVAVGGEGEIRLWDLQQYQVTKARRERQRRRWLLRTQQMAQEGQPLSSFLSASKPAADDEDGEASGSEKDDAPEEKKSSSGKSLHRRKNAASAAPLALDWGEDTAGEAGVSCLVGTDGRVLSLAFGEMDDRILLSGGTDGVVRLWPSYPSAAWASTLLDEDEGEALEEKGEERQLKKAPGTGESGAQESAEGEGEQAPRSVSRGLPGSRSSVVSPLCVYRGALAAVWALDVGPYGHYFASGSSDNCARLWCTSRSFPLRLLQHPAAATDVFHVAFHPNSSLLLTAASDNCVRLFDLRSAQLARAWAPLLLPVVDGEARGRATEEPEEGDGEQRDRQERRERRGTDRKVEKHDSSPFMRRKRVYEDVKKPGAKHLRLGKKRGSPVFRASDDEEEEKRQAERRRSGRVTALAMSPNGRLAAVGDSAGGVCVFDIPSGRPLAIGSSPSMQKREERFSPLHFPPSIASLSFCHGSSFLASAAVDGTVALWDTSGGALQIPEADGTFRQKSGLFAGRPVTALSLAETYGASHVAFRSCLFSPENLLFCLGFSTLCSDEDFL
ncbi:transcription initiation factor TFIID subunit TAF5 [Toxoplasma gondii TgCatPRC2]|uniref:Transcription initiation factor TFIID subunit TAF5 n=4 Tax=Toxoplasma gondii TaxID=5811 RepID=S7UKI4_TOXGG|nr:transcription initiation factor TFIID subunit TAF5 [Toxoplasma gondii GT1]KAF4645012.1 transcription initiation factor TFIID subunit TAF5 [Toxoplasma gondii]KYF39499.1 transcription initiation factor TFIID subunit TAF5 [Toxoplasma gondii ARI]KYK66959.1 transcription initiation factor TFIID subunit TAF5 [Toxoplasma gondii TgCatPRC2]